MKSYTFPLLFNTKFCFFLPTSCFFLCFVSVCRVSGECSLIDIRLFACCFAQFSWLVFLCLYGIILLTDFYPYPTIDIKEIILIIWIFSLMTEEIRQVFLRFLHRFVI